MKKAILIVVLLLAMSTYVYVTRILPSHEVDPTVRASGVIEATRYHVSPKIPARIADILAQEGDTVARGAVLVRLDCGEVEARKRQADAQVQTAKAGLLQSRAQREQVKAQLGPLTVQQELARKQHDRMWTLRQSQSIPEQSYEQAKAALDTLDQQITAARRAVDVARQVVEVTDRQVALAAESAEVIRVTLDECEIRAPADGVVLSRNYEPGEMAFPGASILKMGQLDFVHTWLYVPNEELGRIRLGQEVRLNADTYPEREFSGRIVRIREEAEFTPKSIQTKEDRTRLVFGVKVEIENTDRALMPGMPVEAWVPETAPKMPAGEVRDGE